MKADGGPCGRKATRSGYCWQHSEKGHRSGRRSGLTPERRDEFLRHIASGTTIRDACAMAGIGEASYYRWMETGEADAERDRDTPYRKFRVAVEQARCEARVTALQHIRDAMPKNWRAAAWYLERTQPEEWGKPDRYEIKHSGDLRTEVPKTPDTPERLQEVASILREVGVIK